MVEKGIDLPITLIHSPSGLTNDLEHLGLDPHQVPFNSPHLLNPTSNSHRLPNTLLLPLLQVSRTQQREMNQMNQDNMETDNQQNVVGQKEKEKEKEKEANQIGTGQAHQEEDQDEGENLTKEEEIEQIYNGLAQEAAMQSAAMTYLESTNKISAMRALLVSKGETSQDINWNVDSLTNRTIHLNNQASKRHNRFVMDKSSKRVRKRKISEVGKKQLHQRRDPPPPPPPGSGPLKV